MSHTEEFRLWCIGGRGLWLPKSVTVADIADVADRRDRWDALSKHLVMFYARFA